MRTDGTLGTKRRRAVSGDISSITTAPEFQVCTSISMVNGDREKNRRRLKKKPGPTGSAGIMTLAARFIVSLSRGLQSGSGGTWRLGPASRLCLHPWLSRAHMHGNCDAVRTPESTLSRSSRFFQYLNAFKPCQPLRWPVSPAKSRESTVDTRQIAQARKHTLIYSANLQGHHQGFSCAFF